MNKKFVCMFSIIIVLAINCSGNELNEEEIGKYYESKNIDILIKKGNIIQVLISEKSKITTSDLKYISQLQKLQLLDLWNDCVNDQFFIHTNLPSRIYNLSIRSKNITDESLKYISKLPKLGILDLSYTSITDNGLKHIKDMKLGTLIISHTKISKDGFRYLKEMKSLDSVSIFGINVTKSDVDWLQNQLPECDIKWDGGTYDTNP